MRSLLITATAAALSLPVLADPSSDSQTNSSAPDMLRFNNGDTLHGSFHSFGDNQTLIWRNPEAGEPIHFSTKKTQRIILNRGLGHLAIRKNSSLSLINGDIIPGIIVSANEKSITVDTDHLGQLTIPREAVSKLEPTPFGGKLIYYGPLNTDGWKTASPPSPPKKDQDEKAAEPEEAAKKAKPDTKKDKKASDWQHIAAAWYAGSDKYRYLIRENALPDKCRLTFKLAWRGSLYSKIIIHADMAPPENKTTHFSSPPEAATVGHAYVIGLSTHSATLYSTSFDENGKPSDTRVDNAHVSLNLSGQEEAQFELRIDRPNKQLLLYLNGQFKIKWNLGDNYGGKGNTLAFRNLRYSNAQLRISDIVVSEWNGLKDSAESMTSADRDIILLTNGVDRFSGQFEQLKDDKVSFHGTYNNVLTIPTNEVQEIHFASNKLRKVNEDAASKSVYFYVLPYGRVSGIPSKGPRGETILKSDILGEITLDTRYINIIDFSHQNSLLDLWDDNF